MCRVIRNDDRGVEVDSLKVKRTKKKIQREGKREWRNLT